MTQRGWSRTRTSRRLSGAFARTAGMVADCGRLPVVLTRPASAAGAAVGRTQPSARCCCGRHSPPDAAVRYQVRLDFAYRVFRIRMPCFPSTARLTASLRRRVRRCRTRPSASRGEPGVEFVRLPSRCAFDHAIPNPECDYHAPSPDNSVVAIDLGSRQSRIWDMQRKRKVRLCWLGLCVMLLLGFFLFHIGGGKSRTQSQLEQIRIGMSRDEVIEVFGMPNGRLSDPNVLSWVRKSDQAVIYFDENGRVRKKEWYDSSMDPWWIRLLRHLQAPS